MRKPSLRASLLSAAALGAALVWGAVELFALQVSWCRGWLRTDRSLSH